MANPVVHFEVLGKDAGTLAKFYGEAFGWQLQDVMEGSYYMVDGKGGIPGGVGVSPDGSDSVTFYVQVDDPAVTQADLGSTICRAGYTKTVRPPESITEREKQASLLAYGDHRPLHFYEYDHLVALELGGARNDARNLWPEPGATPNPKDSLEARLHARVCDGEMSLSAAQLAIARDWVAAYKRFIGPEPTAP